MAERKLGKTLTPQPAGQPRLPRITGMRTPAHFTGIRKIAKHFEQMTAHGIEPVRAKSAREMELPRP